MRYTANNHDEVHYPDEAIETALFHARRGELDAAHTYAQIALAMQAGEPRYRTIPSQGWVLLECDGDDLFVQHVLAFQERESASGDPMSDLYPVVWDGQAVGSSVHSKTSVLVRAAALCASRRRFYDIADTKPTDDELAWILAHYPELQAPKREAAP